MDKRKLFSKLLQEQCWIIIYKRFAATRLADLVQNVTDEGTAKHTMFISSAIYDNWAIDDPWAYKYDVGICQNSTSSNGRLKNVTVKFAALENSVLPRLPKLVFDKSAIGGVSSIELDQEGNYTEGEFQFRVVTDADAETILSESYMSVKEVLVQLRASDAGFSSDVVSVNVVKK